MRYAALSFFVLMIWVIPFRYYYVCKIKQHCQTEVLPKENQPLPAQTQRKQNLLLVDGDSVVIEGFQQFYFQPELSQPDMTPENEAFLDVVAAYLISNPNKELTITAIIHNGRSMAKLTENLGDERALNVGKQIAQRGINEERIRYKTVMTQDSLSSGPLTFDIRGLYRAQTMR